MSKSLYIEAIEAAEQIKLSAEEKVKQKLIESMTPQIKLLVEKRLMEDEDVSSEEAEEYGMESVDEGLGGCCDEEEVVELDENSKRILSKFITDSAKKEAMHNKIEELRESINSLKKVVVLSKNQKINSTIKEKIVVLHKNIVSEIKNIKSNDIFKKDSNLLREFYRLNKELNSMSKRRSSKDYLSEDLETLLEMNLFEADEEDKEMSDEEAPADDDLLAGLGDLDMKEEEPEAEEAEEAEKESEEDEEPADEPQGDVGPDTTVEELAIMAGLLDEDEEEVEESMGETMYEVDEMLAADLDEEDEKDSDEAKEGYHMEDMQESADRIFEIDENMLRREIGRMKALREGEVSAEAAGLSNLDEMKTKAAKVVRKNRMLESKLSQYKEALRQMKGQLQEMNLFNAKLLYANKLMQNRDLSIKQQRNIVESLDEAKTLSEAKILFESLSKSLVSGPAKRSENLSEGAIRRSTGSSSAPVRSAQTLTESVALNRWATLAGIKK